MSERQLKSYQLLLRLLHSQHGRIHIICHPCKLFRNITKFKKTLSQNLTFLNIFFKASLLQEGKLYDRVVKNNTEPETKSYNEEDFFQVMEHS